MRSCLLSRIQLFWLYGPRGWTSISCVAGWLSQSQQGFPGGSVVKNLPVNSEDAGLIPGWGRSPGGGNGNPLQYSCQKNPMDRGARQGYSPKGCKESDVIERLSRHKHKPIWLGFLEHLLQATQRTKKLHLFLYGSNHKFFCPNTVIDIYWDIVFLALQ